MTGSKHIRSFQKYINTIYTLQTSSLSKQFSPTSKLWLSRAIIIAASLAQSMSRSIPMTISSDFLVPCFAVSFLQSNFTLRFSLTALDPAQHVPVTHPYTGQIEHWGIIPPDDDNNPNAPPAIMTRFMQLQQNMWYMGTDWPEVQFVKHLMKLKKEKLQAALAGGEDRSKCDYVFKIWMPRIKTRHGGHNLIWRRFRVSGGMRLDVFSDKVLMPIMGW